MSNLSTILLCVVACLHSSISQPYSQIPATEIQIIHDPYQRPYQETHLPPRPEILPEPHPYYSQPRRIPYNNRQYLEQKLHRPREETYVPLRPEPVPYLNPRLEPVPYLNPRLEPVPYHNPRLEPVPHSLSRPEPVPYLSRRPEPYYRPEIFPIRLGPILTSGPQIEPLSPQVYRPSTERCPLSAFTQQCSRYQYFDYTTCQCICRQPSRYQCTHALQQFNPNTCQCECVNVFVPDNFQFSQRITFNQYQNTRGSRRRGSRRRSGSRSRGSRQRENFRRISDFSSDRFTGVIQRPAPCPLGLNLNIRTCECYY